MTSLRIAVISGGRSSEAEVSRTSGAQVLAALKGLGHTVVALDCDDELWEALRAGGYDCAFLALHGRYGEDGTVQGVCELLGVPYTGSPVLASAVAFDKGMSKQVLGAAGVATPPWHVLARTLSAPDALTRLHECAAELGLPLVVKPNRGGSTIGLSIVADSPDLKAAFDAAAWHDDVLCERFVRGTEVTVGVLGHNPPQALPTLEIVSHRPLYDYQAKYQVGQSEHIIPARLPAALNLSAQRTAEHVHAVLGCRGFSRVDLIVDGAGTPWVLEVNTIPGLTPLSLLPDAARAAGVAFEQLCQRLVDDAIARHQEAAGPA
ncbi:MAG TPA: D-alanine--D-alanine ligase [Candidatus Dormibacteraeota bacterium]